MEWSCQIQKFSTNIIWYHYYVFPDNQIYNIIKHICTALNFLSTEPMMRFKVEINV